MAVNIHTVEKGSSKQPISVNALVRRIVFIPTVILIIIICSYVTMRMYLGGISITEIEAQKHTELAKHEILSTIRQYLLIMEYHSTNPLLKQSAMQSTKKLPHLSDFLDGVTLFGTIYRQLLVDYQGRLIYDSDNSRADIANSQSIHKWLTSLLQSGNKQSYSIVKLNDGKYYWALGHTVEYQGSVEGALVSIIPFQKLLESIDIDSSISIEYLLANDLIYKHGNGREFDARNSVTDPNTGLVMVINYNNETLGTILFRLVGETLLIALMITLLTLILSYRTIYRRILAPIGELRKFSHCVTNREIPRNCLPVNPVSELQDLAIDLDTMAAKIDLREKELKHKSSTLEKLNKDLQSANRKLETSHKALVQSEKMASLGTMAAGVAHEINNPMGYVRNNIEVLGDYLNILLPLLSKCGEKENTCDNMKCFSKSVPLKDFNYIVEDTPGLMKDTLEGTNRVSDIVSALRSFAHVDNMDDKGQFDINASIETSLKVVWNKIKYKCEVRKSLSELPTISGNAGKFNQVLVNLLINAAHAIEDKGVIEITTIVKSHAIRVCISDDGIGIAPNDLKQVFNPFFTTKPIGVGTGLGLSVSHGIVESLGGSIDVKSSLGEGTTFTIWLPINGDSYNADKEGTSV